MQLSFSTDMSQVNCCPFSRSKNTGKPLARIPSSIYIFSPKLLFNTKGRRSSLRRYGDHTKAKALAYYRIAGLRDGYWRRTDTSVTETFEECGFQVNAFRPICFLIIVFTVLPQFYERCFISVITTTHIFVRRMDTGGRDFPHRKKSCRSNVKLDDFDGKWWVIKPLVSSY